MKSIIMGIIHLLPAVLLIILLLAEPTHAQQQQRRQGGDGGGNVEIPAELLAKALNHVVSQQSTPASASTTTASTSAFPDVEATIESLQSGSVDALYRVANSMNRAAASGDGGNNNNSNNNDDKLTSIQIYHVLADGASTHIPSMVQLGFTYSEVDKTRAIQYFIQAGEDGPHQAALYNAGRLLLEDRNDYGKALAYIRAAATLGDDKHTAMYAKPQMTNLATKAYSDLSQMISDSVHGLSLQQLVDIFPYGSIHNFPKEKSREDKLWDGAMKRLSDDKKRNDEALENVRKDLKKLLDVGHDKMSDLQRVVLVAIVGETYKLGTGTADEL